MGKLARIPSLVLVVLLTRAAMGEAQSVDASRRNAIVVAIEKASPAVVSVNVIRETARDPFFEEFWGFFRDSGPLYPLRKYEKIDCVGSGFFIDDQGHILTNSHVVEGSVVRSVTLPDGRELAVELVAADQRTDIAVLRATGENLPRATLGNSDDLMIGEWVIAIGNPFGVLMGDRQPTASVGVVSANRRRISPNVGGGERLYQDMIQTDAAINPGNSGGPLVNADGQVVGVSTMIFTPSGGSIGLGFAIPINRARQVADEIIQYGRRRYPEAGFKVESVSSIRDDILRELGITARAGCVVLNILSSSPAYEAGLRLGDVITAINGQAVTQPTDIDFLIWSLFIGDAVTLDIDRQGAPRTLQFKITELGH